MVCEEHTPLFCILSIYSVGHTHVDSLRAMGDADTVITTMKFPNNVLATIDISRNSAYGYDQRVEIFGKDGMMRFLDRYQCLHGRLYSDKRSLSLL